MRTVMTPESMRELGRVIRTLRKAKGWTQIRLAEESGMSRNAIIKLEHGEREPHASTIDKVARALGVDLYELAGVRLAGTLRSKDETPSMRYDSVPSESPVGVMGFLAATHLEARRQAEATGKTEDEVLAETEREYARKYGSIFGAGALPLDAALDRSRGVSIDDLGVPLDEAQEYPPGEGLSDEIVAQRHARA